MNSVFRVGIGLDIGEKRIGVARGDLEVRFAAPLDPIMNQPDVFAKIANVFRENQAEFLVAGLPRNSKGEETKQSEFSRNFVDQLRKQFAKENMSIEIYFQDESLTSVKAEEFLRVRPNFRESMLRDGTLDSEAAAIILGDFLDSGEVKRSDILHEIHKEGESERKKGEAEFAADFSEEDQRE